jgi:hypothetical protein
MSRWIRFLIVIILGIVLGLLYGWLIDPIEYVDTTPETLGADFKADLVLMVAEIYHSDRDIESALQRLTLLQDPSPLESVQNAIIFAVEVGYTAEDLRLLRDLADTLAPLASPAAGEAP